MSARIKAFDWYTGQVVEAQEHYDLYKLRLEAVKRWENQSGKTIKGLRFRIRMDEAIYLGLPEDRIHGGLHHELEPTDQSQESLCKFYRRLSEEPRIYVLELDPGDPYLALEFFQIRSAEAEYRLRQLGFRQVDQEEFANLRSLEALRKSIDPMVS